MIIGVGYRLDHSPLLLHQTKGAEGHTLHGGAVEEVLYIIVCVYKHVYK